jgi:hypothetical protein
MIKTPCEIVLWNFLPSLRRELVKAMSKNGLKRKEIAKSLDVTEAAVCQYLKSKRGTRFKFNKTVKKRIEKVAMEVVKSKKKETVVLAICEICATLRKQKALCKLHQKENPCLLKCDLYKTVSLRRR